MPKITGTRKDMAKQRVILGELVLGGVTGTRFPGERDDGTNWYVNSVTGASTNDGKSPNSPRASLASVLDDATIAANDTIWLMAGHNEAVAAAAGLDVDTAGLTIYFLGSGANRAKITFGTATTADMDIDAANVTLVHPYFVCDIDALAAPIDVNAAGFTIIDGECHDSAAKAASIWVIGDANADRMEIDGWKFLDSTTGTQKTENIRVVGADDVILRNLNIVGDFSTAAVNNVTTAAPNLLIENATIVNSNSGPAPGITLVSTTTGWMKNVSIRIASGSTFVTANNDMQFDRCFGVSADATQSVPIGLPNYLTDPVFGNYVSKAATIASAPDALFDITGIAEITRMIGIVTSVIATSTSMSINTSTSDMVISASTQITTDAVGTVYVVSGDIGLGFNAGATPTVDGAVLDVGTVAPFYMSDDQIEQNVNSAGTGLITWHLWWKPISAGATVAAAA